MPFPASIVAFLLLAALTTPAAFAAGEELKDAHNLLSQGKHAQALEQVDKYLEDNSDDVQAQFLRGVILAEQNRADEAIRMFTTITEQHPELPEPYNNLAVLYAEQGQYDKARKSLEQAIKTHPSYATAHENLGDIYAKLATDAYDKALQLDQSNTRAQTKLAMVKELFPAGSGAGTARPLGGKQVKVVRAGSASPKLADASAKKPAVKPATVTAEPATAEPEKAKPAVATVSPPAAKAAASGNNDQTAALSDSVQSWAKAWASKNVDGYLAHYASNFKVPSGESRSSWEDTRRKRISAPKSISVEISSFKVVSVDDNQARVSFSQRYKAGRLAQRTAKTLILQKSGDKWLIEQELVGR